MSRCIQTFKRLLHFKQPVGTSRGIYTTRIIWFIVIKEDSSMGVGECAPLPELSCDDLPHYEAVLEKVCNDFKDTGIVDYIFLRDYPSILFGMETALLNLRSESLRLWDTPFSRGEEFIKINGLVWMGSFEEMHRRIEEKLSHGFHCVKLKIGAIEFDKEIELVESVRRCYTEQQIELRLDANGAFSADEALEKLKILSQYGIHSIEQPIKAGNWKTMALLCRDSPIPIALDEELIGINERERKIELLECVKPRYIVLKPSLHGGLRGAQEWIELAAERNIGFWVTSALESNIGLNAIAQWCATIPHTLPQGLGTGLLYTDNIDTPLYIKEDSLCYDTSKVEPSVMEWLQIISIDGKYYSQENIDELNSDVEVLSRFYGEIRDFLKEWWNGGDTIELQTSGSTGAPKRICAQKSSMIASARATISFFKLRQNDNALLCLPMDYIAGKMMVVRALVGGMNLICSAPSGFPLREVGGRNVRFAAMIPLQVYNSLNDESGREVLGSIDNVIIGGGAIDWRVEETLSLFHNKIWATYGMTETLSHIALRPISGSEASEWFTPLNEINIGLSECGTLVVKAPSLCQEDLITNDLTLFDDLGRFKILGRTDNIINSGGIKVQIEEVEKRLAEILNFPFMITSSPDEKLGEKIVLLACTQRENQSLIEEDCQNSLPRHWVPREIIFIDKLPMTASGKPDRVAARKLEETIIESI